MIDEVSRQKIRLVLENNNSNFLFLYVGFSLNYLLSSSPLVKVMGLPLSLKSSLFLVIWTRGGAVGAKLKSLSSIPQLHVNNVWVHHKYFR